MAQQVPSEPTYVTTFLNGYTVDDGKRVPLFLREQTKDEKAIYKTTLAPRSTVKTNILSARNQNLSLDKNSFELIHHTTALSTESFYVREKVTSIYYDEIAQAIKEATGAQVVYIFHHQVRNAEAASGMVGSTAGVQGYANGIHSDTHPQAADSLFKNSLSSAQSQAAASGLDVDLSKGRYMYLNAWRNISSEPVQQSPLAVCDEASLCKPDDYLASEVFGLGYTMQQYRLNARNSSRHRWYYFPQMTKDEILLFKQFDSDVTLSGRSCFHTAFDDPTSPPDAPARESIEVRALCFFPDHQPNTCPEIDSARDEDRVEAAARRLTSLVKSLSSWPLMAQQFVVLLRMVPGGAKMLAKRLVQDKQGHFNLSSLSDAQRAEIVALMMKSRDQGGMEFEEEFKKAVAIVRRQGVLKLYTSGWMGTIFLSVLSVGLGWSLGRWSWRPSFFR